MKEVVARIKKIFKFENPKTFNVNKSLLFLIFNINHILDKKMIKEGVGVDMTILQVEWIKMVENILKEANLKKPEKWERLFS